MTKILVIFCNLINLHSRTFHAAAAAAASDVDLGTTVLAMRFRDGVVVASDTRTSIGGSLVSHRFANKLVALPLSTKQKTLSEAAANSDSHNRPSFCVVARSGSAADTQHLCDLVQWEAADRFYRYSGGSSASASSSSISMTVRQVAYYLRSLIREQGESSRVSLIIAGYHQPPSRRRKLGDQTRSKTDDENEEEKEENNSDSQFTEGYEYDDDDGDDSVSIYSLSSSGALLSERNYAAAGSGSTFILGFLDDQVKQQLLLQQQQRRNGIIMSRIDNKVLLWDKTRAKEVCQKAIELAMDRDHSSGGLIRMMVCTKDGIEEEIIYPTTTMKLMIQDQNDMSSSGSQKLAGFADPVPNV